MRHLRLADVPARVGRKVKVEEHVAPAAAGGLRDTILDAHDDNRPLLDQRAKDGEHLPHAYRTLLGRTLRTVQMQRAPYGTCKRPCSLLGPVWVQGVGASRMPSP